MRHSLKSTTWDDERVREGTKYYVPYTRKHTPAHTIPHTHTHTHMLAEAPWVELSGLWGSWSLFYIHHKMLLWSSFFKTITDSKHNNNVYCEKCTQLMWKMLYFTSAYSSCSHVDNTVTVEIIYIKFLLGHKTLQEHPIQIVVKRAWCVGHQTRDFNCVSELTW